MKERRIILTLRPFHVSHNTHIFTQNSKPFSWPIERNTSATRRSTTPSSKSSTTTSSLSACWNLLPNTDTSLMKRSSTLSRSETASGVTSSPTCSLPRSEGSLLAMPLARRDSCRRKNFKKVPSTRPKLSFQSSRSKAAYAFQCCILHATYYTPPIHRSHLFQSLCILRYLYQSLLMRCTFLSLCTNTYVLSPT